VFCICAIYLIQTKSLLFNNYFKIFHERKKNFFSNQVIIFNEKKIPIYNREAPQIIKEIDFKITRNKMKKFSKFVKK